jgi:hypothetical protein
MAKSRRRRRNVIVRQKRKADLAKVQDTITDMEQPLLELGALLWAFDLISAGMQGRGDCEGGEAVAMVAECARTRLEALKKRWNLVFQGRRAVA